VKPSGRPMTPMTQKQFNRVVRDLDAAKRRFMHSPRVVVLLQERHFTYADAATCLSAAFDLWAMAPHCRIVAYLGTNGQTPAWSYHPTPELAPREF
jgi:hypothetical protein